MTSGVVTLANLDGYFWCGYRFDIDHIVFRFKSRSISHWIVQLWMLEQLKYFMAGCQSEASHKYELRNFITFYEIFTKFKFLYVRPSFRLCADIANEWFRWDLPWDQNCPVGRKVKTFFLVFYISSKKYLHSGLSLLFLREGIVATSPRSFTFWLKFLVQSINRAPSLHLIWHSIKNFAPYPFVYRIHSPFRFKGSVGFTIWRRPTI